MQQKRIYLIQKAVVAAAFIFNTPPVSLRCDLRIAPGRCRTNKFFVLLLWVQYCCPSRYKDKFVGNCIHIRHVFPIIITAIIHHHILPTLHSMQRDKNRNWCKHRGSSKNYAYTVVVYLAWSSRQISFSLCTSTLSIYFFPVVCLPSCLLLLKSTDYVQRAHQTNHLHTT